LELHKVKTGKKKFGGSIPPNSNSPSKSFRNSRDDRGSRYSRDDRREESTTVTCSDCGTECRVPFVPRTDRPVYCSDCFRQNKPQDSGNDRYSRDDRGSRYSRDDRGSRYSRDDRGSRYSRDDRGSRYSRDDRREESATVTCSDCGTECQVPFVPRNNKPVYCSDCFRQNKPQDSGSDRYSRDDRGSRYSRNDRGSRSSRDDFRSKKPKTDKFLKKQETFYSGGSEKFYNTIKEKLFEILGGKVCSGCGFKDERALGFSHISDGDTFDNVQRGGFASSFGKYISDPDLARNELKILCLNCNEVNKPVSTPERKTSGSSKKKKRFPR
jgi:CxxC-x17-CxxC domain-containing protein